MADPLKFLSFDDLRGAVAGDTVAIRGRATLEAAGGPGDKVFPPSHSVDKNERRPGAKYAFEERWRPGRESAVRCVLLDSVQSQANRMEEALEALWIEKRLTLPVIAVDFKEIAPDVGLLTSLSAPHRIADALLRDSLLDGKLFRFSEVGTSFTDASTRNAGPLFKVCPTGLLFGLWDSTGPNGGSGSKFARALVSEVVGIDAREGVRTSSRIDPAQIQNAAGVLYIKKQTADEPLTWTLNEAEAEKGDGKALKWGSKKKDGKWIMGEGKPTTANHSNIPPRPDTLAGGVTIDHAEQIVVLSLAGLRKLRFGEGDIEARTVLAALGLLAVLAAESRGYDLRSRCLLIPRKGESLKLESVARDGSTAPFALDLKGALSVYEEAVKALPKGLRFDQAPGVALATLTPSPKLAHLVKESRRLASTGAADEEV